MGLSELPLDNGRTHVKVLQSFGWVVRRSDKGHLVMTKGGMPVVLSIPDHKEVDRKLLMAELRKAEIDTAEYRKRYDSVA
jgi:predicted RNA binding protein YcfA (HicA-like mRNA interferase family)